MTDTLRPDGRRARILRAASDQPVTLSEICRRVRARDLASKKDLSLHRLKTTAAVRRLKQDGLLTRTPIGWRATAEGRDAGRID